eukprot:876436-Amphidinium_carterae.1
MSTRRGQRNLTPTVTEKSIIQLFSQNPSSTNAGTFQETPRNQGTPRKRDATSIQDRLDKCWFRSGGNFSSTESYSALSLKRRVDKCE